MKIWNTTSNLINTSELAWISIIIFPAKRLCLRWVQKFRTRSENSASVLLNNFRWLKTAIKVFLITTMRCFDQMLGWFVYVCKQQNLSCWHFSFVTHTHLFYIGKGNQINSWNFNVSLYLHRSLSLSLWLPSDACLILALFLSRKFTLLMVNYDCMLGTVLVWVPAWKFRNNLLNRKRSCSSAYTNDAQLARLVPWLRLRLWLDIFISLSFRTTQCVWHPHTPYISLCLHNDANRRFIWLNHGVALK